NWRDGRAPKRVHGGKRTANLAVPITFAVAARLFGQPSSPYNEFGAEKHVAGHERANRSGDSEEKMAKSDGWKVGFSGFP
uniref:Transposase n=1 Tax=Bursaphelenchus xylophilus TaxID=6326 RepID=A0A1I7SNT4_BURXY